MHHILQIEARSGLACEVTEYWSSVPGSGLVLQLPASLILGDRANLKPSEISVIKKILKVAHLIL